MPGGAKSPSGGAESRAAFAGGLRRGFARAVRYPGRILQNLRAQAPERLLIAPQDIRTADAILAEDIYGGYFAFAGRMVHTKGRSPFEMAGPTREWERGLAGFGWLRHLRAADTLLARANARALIDDFITATPALRDKAAFEPGVIARRMLSWLAQSPIVLSGAEAEFYQRFLKALGRDAQLLENAYREDAGTTRLTICIALAELALCADLGTRALTRASNRLANELSRQILADGGHIGRNPQTLIDVLLDLLPLRQAYVARGIAPPDALPHAIDRILPMLRLLRHGDGALALFNGMGVTAPERIATIIAYDDSHGRALANAPHTGYQRLENGDAVVIADTGAPPPAIFSEQAHAGCLSFEFSIGSERIVVNCGSPALARLDARVAARQTAAHSTLIVDDVSSCRISAGTDPAKTPSAGPIVSGPRNVTVARRTLPDATMLQLSHDGYARRFGVTHERQLALTADGLQLFGEDRLVSGSEGRLDEPKAFALRFHMHPSATVELLHEGMAVAIGTPSGRTILFEAGGKTISVEESIFFAAPDGTRACQQIVVESAADPTPIEWSFSLPEATLQP